jgi:fructose-specific phosphotransferase system IIC component
MIHVCSPLHNILIILIMPIVETILTVAAVNGLVNRLIRVFHSIKKWLKNNDHLNKENKRMMKILKDYSEHNKNSSKSHAYKALNSEGQGH